MSLEIGTPEIITLLLFPLVLSFYWNVSIVSFVLRQRCGLCSPTVLHCPSTQAPTLSQAIHSAKTTMNIFGTKTIQTIHLSGAHVLPKKVVLNDTLSIIANTETIETCTIKIKNDWIVTGNMTLHGIQIVNGKGINVTDGGTLTLLECHVTRCKSSGVVVRRGGTLTLDQCCITYNDGSGLVVGDKGSTIDIEDSNISHNQSNGVYSYFGGVCDLRGAKTVVSANESNDLRARGGEINIHDDLDLSCTRQVEENGLIV